MVADVSTDVCIVGGGPAGVMLGLLLSRAGVDVVVLEKHRDFFRDFRGDTVHPSTLNLIDALGLREKFDAIAHLPLPALDAVVNGVRLHAVDLSTLPPPNRTVTLMPQWDLLALLADAAKQYSSFRLMMDADATGVVAEAGRVRGVRARTASGELVVRARVTIAADGRASDVRRALGLVPVAYGVPADVLWFRLPMPPEGLPDTLLWATEEGMVITIPRPDYLQCGLLIPKGSADDLRDEGLESFRARVVRAVPRLQASVDGLASLDDVKLLSVQIDRLRRWYVPGALCIGDAAHAMSPAFGVGINYAIQDAVATANELIPVLLAHPSEEAVDRALAAVQRRRALPTLLMQRLQRAAHRVIANGRGVRLLHNPPTRRERVVLRLAMPPLRPIAARVLGYGFRPETIRRR